MSAEPVVTGRFRLLWLAFLLTWLGVAGLVLASGLVMLVALILLGGVGMPLTLGALPWLRGFADWHRGVFRRLTGRGIDRPYLPEPAGRWSVRLGAAARDPAYWRDGAWLLVNGTAGVSACLAVVTLFTGGSLRYWPTSTPDIRICRGPGPGRMRPGVRGNARRNCVWSHRRVGLAVLNVWAGPKQGRIRAGQSQTRRPRW
jgi:hypothetical protein